MNGGFEMRLYSVGGVYSDDIFVMPVPFTMSGVSEVSGWAKTEMEKPLY